MKASLRWVLVSLSFLALILVMGFRWKKRQLDSDFADGHLNLPLADRALSKYDKIKDPHGRGVFIERRRRLRATCNQIRMEGSTRFSSKFDNLYLYPEGTFTWCPVFKSGSSNWMANFYQLAPITEAERDKIDAETPSLLNRAKAVRKPMSQRMFFNHKRRYPDLDSFILVRHPFHRLVSAFRDKLERLHNTEYTEDFYYKLYGHTIVSKYRDEAIRRFGREHFSEANNLGAVIPVTGERVVEMPIFWEFVQWMLKKRVQDLDEHWSPIMQGCMPCTMDYEIIVKLENYEGEEEWLEEYLGISGKVESPSNMNKYQFGDVTSIEEITQVYFDTLDHSDIQKLFALYKNDFLMFGYSFFHDNTTFP